MNQLVRFSCRYPRYKYSLPGVRHISTTTTPRIQWRTELVRIGVPPHPRYESWYDRTFKVPDTSVWQKERLDPPRPFDVDVFQPKFIITEKPISSLIRSLFLNKKSTNSAYDYWMMDYIEEQVRKWDTNNVTMSHSVRGEDLCGGVDYRELHEAYKLGDKEYIYNYYKKMYQLALTVGTCRKPAFNIARGYCLGAIGASMIGNTTCPIATKEAMFSITETTVGWFTDAGVSHMLANKLKDGIGLFLGLTGWPLWGADLYYTGIVDYMLNWDDLYTFDCSMGAFYSDNLLRWARNMAISVDDPLHFNPVVDQHFELIKECFGDDKATIEEVFAALEKNNDSGKFGVPVLKKLKQMNPLTLKLSFKLIRDAKGKTLKEVVKRDWIVAQNLFKTSNWIQAVEFVVEKKQPVWKHSSIAEVTDEEIEKLLIPGEGVEDHAFLQTSDVLNAREMYRKAFNTLKAFENEVDKIVDDRNIMNRMMNEKRMKRVEKRQQKEKPFGEFQAISLPEGVELSEDSKQFLQNVRAGFRQSPQAEKMMRECVEIYKETLLMEAKEEKEEQAKEEAQKARRAGRRPRRLDSELDEIIEELEHNPMLPDYLGIPEDEVI